ncbi:MAG: tRNA (adenosine(37)-N6)-threonylcarbamoyltransferase complex dimerization subunit type 1 TsaB [Micromonosporaceae bacterium]|nr:tRNA (adenosine(37)-N6)-threonylcarbamoyltransferase complex dimerization subunit type 1 TsaB [Micromonosporaceae bacterium]
MRILVVDTATPAVTAAVAEVAESGVTLGPARITVNPRAHGELLSPAIQAALTEARIAPADLDAIVAGVGPGPYTGLRVGLVTATALGQALGVPTYGVCSLDGIGAAASAPGRLLAATDARRREIYWRVYDDGAPVTEPAVDQPAEVARQLPQLGVARAAGDGALRYAEQLGVPVADEPRFPDAATLVRAACDRILSHAPSEPLTPLYLRRPDVATPGARKPVLR